MKSKFLACVLACLLLLTACSMPHTGADNPRIPLDNPDNPDNPGDPGDPGDAATPAITSAPLIQPQEDTTPAPLSTITPEEEAIAAPYTLHPAMVPPENERVYYLETEAAYSFVEKHTVSGETLKQIGEKLGNPGWGSLNQLLKQHGIGKLNKDILESDTEGRWWGGARLSVEGADDLAAIVLTEETTHRLIHMLLLKKTGEDAYAPLSVLAITSYAWYASQTNIERFIRIADRLFFVLEALEADQAAGKTYTQEWYDCETGNRVLRVFPYAFSYFFDRFDNEEIWEANLNLVPTPTAIGNTAVLFQAERGIRVSIYLPLAQEECNDTLRIYYDLGKRKFFTTNEAVLAIYRQFAKSESDCIAGWAQGYIDEVEALWRKHPQAPISSNRPPVWPF